MSEEDCIVGGGIKHSRVRIPAQEMWEINRFQRNINRYSKIRNRVSRRVEAVARNKKRLLSVYPPDNELPEPKRAQTQLYYSARCSDCNSADLELDKTSGDTVCNSCGLVALERWCADSVNNEEHHYRDSAPYNFLYHFNEVWSAYKGGGPPVEQIDLDAIRRYLCRTRILEFTERHYRVDASGESLQTLNPLLMERAHWHQLCKEIGFPPLAERWVQIKCRLLPTSFRMFYPRAAEENLIRKCFAEWAAAFTQRFYATGKRRTPKDNTVCNSGLFCRHNMPHYSWIIQQIAHHLDPQMRHRYALDKYFPLQKTPGVVKRLQLIWVHVCRDLGWEISILK